VDKIYLCYLKRDMTIQPKQFKEKPAAQQEIVELEQKLAEKKKELMEKNEPERHNRELIKEIIKEKVEIPELPKTKTALPVQKSVIKKVKQLKSEKKERQIELLTDLAFERGVIHATEVAKKLDSPYILDEFHDSLVDELYNYLTKQGKLKEI